MGSHAIAHRVSNSRLLALFFIGPYTLDCGQDEAVIIHLVLAIHVSF